MFQAVLQYISLNSTQSFLWIFIVNKLVINSLYPYHLVIDPLSRLGVIAIQRPLRVRKVVGLIPVESATKTEKLTPVASLINVQRFKAGAGLVNP